MFLKGMLLVVLIFTYAGMMGMIPDQSSILDLAREDPSPINLTIENGMVLTMEATGYAIGPPYNSITRNESPVINKGFLRIGNVDVFTIAADPKILKMGSVVYIEGLGIGLVHDTGTAIKGMKIDICFTNMDEAMQFGRKNVKVWLLRNGKEE